MEGLPPLTDACTEGELKEEAEMIRDCLTKVLDEHAEQLRVVARSKRWWGPGVLRGRQVFIRVRRAYREGLETP